MEENEYEKLWNSVTGLKNADGSQRFDIGTIEEFTSRMETSDQRRSFYDLMETKGIDLGDYDSYEFRLAGGVKKKDEAQVAPSVSVADGEETSAVSPSISDAPPIASGTPEPLTAKTPDEVPFQEVQFLTGEFGNAINSVPFLGDIIDDSARAIAQGQRQGNVVNDALNVMTKGAAATDEEVNTLIAEIQAMSELGPSEEFQNFQKIATEEGGVFGFMKALANEPGAVTEVFLQSMSSLANKSTVAIAGAAAVPAMGIAGPAGVAATLPYVMAAGGAAMETGLTFAELLQEELKEKGVEFDTEGVRSVLEDEEAMSRIRGKSTIRGGVIGTIDALTGGLAVKVGAKMIRKGSKLKTLAAQSVVEGTGGGFGEAAATVAIGETPTVLDVGMEAVGGAPGAGATFVATAARRGKYRINGQEADRKTVQDVLKHATPKQLAEMNIEIKNDNDLMDVVKEDQAKAQISEAVGDAFSTEAKQKIVELEYEYQQLQGKRDTRSKKRRMAEIEQELDAVMDADKEAKAIETEGPVFEAGLILDGPRGTETYSGRYEQEGEVATQQQDLTKPIDTPPPLTPKVPLELQNRSFTQRARDLIIKRFQDKYIDIFRLQEAAEQKRGKLDEGADFKMAEELFYGRSADRLNKLDQTMSDIKTAMNDAGITSSQLDEYLYARHAKERNAKLRETEGIEDGSGLSDAEADAILESYEKEFGDMIGPDQKSSIEQLHGMVMNLAAENRELMVESGLMSREDVDLMAKEMPNYVPLQGFDADEYGVPGAQQYSGRPSGYDVRGKEGKRASGRESKAATPLAQLISNSANLRIRAERNKALQSLHKLAAENPNENIWNVISPEQLMGMSESQRKRLRESAVGVKIDGKEHFIEFKDPSYVETLKGLDAEKIGRVEKFLRPANNWLRKSFTTLNPEFVFTNFARDIQAAVFNALAETDIEAGPISGKTEVVGRMLKRVPETMKALLQEEVVGKDSKLAQYYSEFKADGGKTGWAYAKSLQEIKQELENPETLDDHFWGKAQGKASGWLKTLEGINDAVENSIRLAAYIEAREAGVSRDKAAQLAKNLTVNFNKSGTSSATLNSLYLFFNAGAQGSARVLRTLNTKKGKLALGGLTLVAGLLDMANRGMSGEDPEDGVLWYDKIPDDVKQRNMIIMTGQGEDDYVKIPLPYGFGAIYNIGTAAADVAAGGRDIEDALFFTGNSFVTGFSPLQVGFENDEWREAGRAFMPTAVQPAYDIIINEDRYGNQVYAEPFPGSTPKPKSETMRRTPQAAQDILKEVNRLTGGDEYVPGAVDINLDRVWHGIDFYLGGAGKTAVRTAKLAKDVIQGQEIKTRNIPFARTFKGNAKDEAYFYDLDQYEENSVNLLQLHKSYKNNRKDRGNPKYKGVVDLFVKYQKSAKKLDNVRKNLKDAYEIENLTERNRRVEELREKRRKTMAQFNKEYNRVRKEKD